MRSIILFIQFLVIGTPHLSKKYEQHTSIKDLQFLIGTWEAEERNKGKYMVGKMHKKRNVYAR